MSDPFLAEIRIFAGNYAPQGWATCDGQNLPISQNTALYSLIANYYGGDGRTTFALPNLKGSAPMGAGNGPGLTQRAIGNAGGSQSVTLNTSQLAGHVHGLQARPVPAQQGAPASNASLALLAPTTSNIYKQPSGANLGAMNAQSIGATGGGGPHNNLQPYLGLTFIISLQGIYPQRP